MKDLLARLTSRTFWITVGALITLAANEQWNEFVGMAVAYVLGEKTVDSIGTRVKTTINAENIESQNIDSEDLVTGTGTVKRRDEELATGKE